MDSATERRSDREGPSDYPPLVGGGPHTAGGCRTNRMERTHGPESGQLVASNRVILTPTRAPTEAAKVSNDSLRFNLTPDSRTYPPLLFSPLLFFDPCLSFSQVYPVALERGGGLARLRF